MTFSCFGAGGPLKWVHQVTPDLIQHVHRTATNRRWAMSHSNTLPVRNRAPLTAWSSSLRCALPAKHHTAVQYCKRGRAKPRKHLLWSDLSWNTHQDCLKIPSLWEAALETKQRCFSKVSLKLNATPNITRSSDSFSTVPAIVWPGDYHSLGLTRNSISFPKGHTVIPLTNPTKVSDQGLCYCNTNAWGWHNSHQSRVISITNQLFLQIGKALECTEGTITSQNTAYSAAHLKQLQPVYTNNHPP